MFLKSFSPGKTDKDFTHAANLQYSGKRWLVSWQHEYVGQNYNAEVGYVPRSHYIKANPTVSRLFFPSSGKVLSHGPKINSTYFFNESFHQTDNETMLTYLVNFRDQAVADVWVAHDYVQLLQFFDPTNSGKDTLATGTKHRWNAYGADFISRPQQLFTFAFSTRYGGYYDHGTRADPFR